MFSHVERKNVFFALPFVDLCAILFLIVMFIIRSSSKLFSISKTTPPILIPSFTQWISQRRAKYSFGSSKWNKKEFLKKLDKQIMDSHAKIVWQDPASQAYFTKKQWKIKYCEEKTIFQYSKVDRKHEIKVLTHVMYEPPNNADHAQQAQQQKKDHNKAEKYSQVAIYIRKKGTDKWLTAEMAVLQGSVELLGVFFTKLQPDFSWQKNTYPGPELKTVPQEIVAGIYTIFTQFGLTPELLMNMVIHASIKVDPLDLQWLNQLREIWS